MRLDGDFVTDIARGIQAIHFRKHIQDRLRKSDIAPPIWSERAKAISHEESSSIGLKTFSLMLPLFLRKRKFPRTITLWCFR